MEKGVGGKNSWSAENLSVFTLKGQIITAFFRRVGRMWHTRANVHMHTYTMKRKRKERMKSMNSQLLISSDEWTDGSVYENLEILKVTSAI